jgi:hypothetical protein
MKVFRRDAESRRLRPNFVARQQPVVAIERRILRAFCHDGWGELLKAHQQLTALFVLHVTKQGSVEEVKGAGEAFGYGVSQGAR